MAARNVPVFKREWLLPLRIAGSRAVDVWGTLHQRSGTAALQRAAPRVMLIACDPTLADQVVLLRAFNLRSGASVFRTRLVLSSIGGLCGDPGSDVVMPIRMRCRDKLRDAALVAEDNGLSTPWADELAASFADREREFGMSCGSS